MADAYSLRVEFKTRYELDKATGQKVPVDYVLYSAPGCWDRSRAIAKISHIDSVIPIGDAPDNEAVGMANLRRDFIMPRYQAWKAGHSMPVDGTPLGAWPAITIEAAEQFRMCGINTVEQVRDMTDGVRSRIAVPNTRELQKQAAMFLDAADKSVATAKMTDLETKNLELASQLEEMKAIMLEMQRDQDDARRRKKPPKDAAAEDAA